MSQISPFGALLGRLRREKGYSCRALGRILGVSHTAIHNVEHGKLRRLAPEHWPALSATFGIPVKDFEKVSEQGVCPSCGGTGQWSG